MFLHLWDILEEQIECELQIVSLYSTLIQSKMSFTYPHVVWNLYNFIHTRKNFSRMSKLFSLV